MKDLSHTLLLFFVLILNQSTAFATNGDTMNSEYLISHGKVIYGNTDINLAMNDAMLRVGRDIIHYPPNQIDKIAVKEGENDEVQLYYSGMFGLNNKQYLFKILSEGNRTLLYREGLKFSAYDETEYPPYFVLVDNQIYSLSTNKKELTKQIDSDYQKELLAYLKNNQIDIQEADGLTELFDYYNVLVEAN